MNLRMLCLFTLSASLTFAADPAITETTLKGLSARAIGPAMMGGRVSEIAFDPADPRRIFVATDRGILRSDDGGIHFHHANQGLGNP